MSNLSVDLKVIEVTGPMVARALGEPLAYTLGCLNLLWHRCWSLKTDTITSVGLAGVFGPEKLEARIAQLVDAGFLEPTGTQFRVRGAERYLRIQAGNSKGGQASKGNLIPGGGRRPKPEGGAEREPRGSREGAENVSRVDMGSSPNTEHRTPNTEHHVEDPPQRIGSGPLVFERPTTEPETWSGENFFAWAQHLRQTQGWVGEKWPRKNLSHWWAEVLGTPGMTADRCGGAFKAFALDAHWRGASPPAPFAAFMSVWRNFVPAARGAA